MNKSTKMRFKDLEGRGWTRDLVTLYLSSDNAWYDAPDVVAVEKTSEWQKDHGRVMAGKPVLMRRDDLRDRGWSRNMITEHLPEPDIEVVLNSAGTRKVYLYKATRVEDLEAEPWWTERAAVAAKRALAGELAAEKRADATREWAESVEIVIPHIPLESLFEQAVEHYQNLWAERGEYRYAPSATAQDQDSRRFLERIAVNYLRHTQSDYEAYLENASGRVAVTEAR